MHGMLTPALAIPILLAIAGGICLFGRKKAYFDAFLLGAREGLQTAVGLLPTLVALLAAIRMLLASGLPDDLALFLVPAAERLGVPGDLLSLLMLRPFSGSASMAAYSSLMEEAGPDSFSALCASVIMASSDTVVYICSVYFSSVGIRRTRHALPCAFAVMFFCIFFACFLCRVFFG